MEHARGQPTSARARPRLVVLLPHRRGQHSAARALWRPRGERRASLEPGRVLRSAQDALVHAVRARRGARPAASAARGPHSHIAWPASHPSIRRPHGGGAVVGAARAEPVQVQIRGRRPRLDALLDQGAHDGHTAAMRARAPCVDLSRQYALHVRRRGADALRRSRRAARPAHDQGTGAGQGLRVGEAQRPSLRHAAHALSHGTD